MEPTPSRDAGNRPSRAIRKEPIEIWAFEERTLYRGAAHRLEGQRMSDIFNDVLSPTLKGPRTRFVPLTNASVTPVTGGQPRSEPFLALGKARVLIAGELAGESASASTVAPAERPSLTLVAVTVRLSAGHELTGTLCRPVGRRTLDVLNDEREFLPLTEVTVTWPGGVSRTFSFLVVNKSQTVDISERTGNDER